MNVLKYFFGAALILAISASLVPSSVSATILNISKSGSAGGVSGRHNTINRTDWYQKVAGAVASSSVVTPESKAEFIQELENSRSYSVAGQPGLASAYKADRLFTMKASLLESIMRFSAASSSARQRFHMSDQLLSGLAGRIIAAASISEISAVQKELMGILAGQNRISN